ncbi:LysR family transcriptional regulator, partial [Stenotrophomonas maltophilia]
MRLTLRQLQVFVAIADHGSTTAAGQAIALSQSASSAALQELEAHFGTPLFDRIGRRLALNGHGR